MAIAAWAVVDADREITLAADSLIGLQQNNDRAELYGVVVAVEWSALTQHPIVIWSDSSYALEGAMRLCVNHFDLPDGPDSDLWSRLQSALRDCGDLPLLQHVPAHRSLAQSTGPLDDWLIEGNRRADQAAAAAHRARDSALLDLWKALITRCPTSSSLRCF